MSSKRKHVSLPLSVKLDALKRIDKGETLKAIAQDLGISAVTVGDWRRNRTKLESWSSKKQFSESAVQSRSRMKESEFEKTSEALYLWFSSMREKGWPISGPILQEKALYFQRQLQEGESFSASTGWLDKWKKRYGVRQLHISGEKLSADNESADSFVTTKFKKLVDEEGYSLDQIYNCDETGLNFRMLPNKSLVHRKETRAPGFKKSKERITVLPCSNATGNHKLRLLIIGKSKKPRAFKNLALQGLPASYSNQKSAWMDKNIFKTWFFDEFVPEVTKFLNERELPQKALLLIDNAPSHPDEEVLCSGDIKAIFLPPNVTSLIQPMDQGVIEALKKSYRRKMLTYMLGEESQEQQLEELLKKINIKDAIYWLADAWSEIKIETLKNSWKKIISSEQTDVTVYEDRPTDNELTTLVQKIPGCENSTEQEIQEWLDSDEKEEITDDEIIKMVDHQATSNADSGEEDEGNQQQKVTHSDGLMFLENALRYVEQQPEVTPSDILFLKRWSLLAARKRCSSEKQKNILDYFKSM